MGGIAFTLAVKQGDASKTSLGELQPAGIHYAPHISYIITCQKCAALFFIPLDTE